MRQLITIVLLFISISIFGQCPESVEIKGNDKCLSLSWDTPPAPLPDPVIEDGDDHDYVSGSGTAGDPAIYQKDGTPNCTGSSYGPFTGTIIVDGESCVYTAGAVLPVTLIYFGAVKANGSIIINWETASEENNEGFEIQKSKNGIDWEVIHWEEGNGTTFEINQYRFEDKNPFSGLNYFRLKQVDYDGVEEIFKAVSLTFGEDNSDFQIVPNPAVNDLSLRNLDLEKVKSITIYNRLGQAIEKFNTTSFQFSTSNFTNGIYFLAVEFQNRERVIRKFSILK